MTDNFKMPNIDLNPHDWEEVKRILKTCVPEYDVWAFGSRVEWTAKDYSDLDLAVITEHPLSLPTIADLKEAFDESSLSVKVDVVDWATTSESFRRIIERKKITAQTGKAALAKWTFKKLIECTLDGNLSYGIVQPGQPVTTGIPIVRVNNFNNGQLQVDDAMRVAPEIESKYKRTRLEGGEVLLTLVGSTGQSAVVPDKLAGWNIARAIAVIRPRPEIGANWINICLQTKAIRFFLDERANTTVQKTLNLSDVREIPIPIPPIEIKEQIEAIVMGLSDKIELNRQINQTLEQIAQAIFKSWFVDFEPVKAKIEAKQNSQDPERAAMRAISGLTDEQLDQLDKDKLKQLTNTAALFPDELEASELGEIPNGWEVSTIGDEVEVVGGGTPSTKNEEFWVDGGINRTTPKDLSGQQDKILLKTEKKITEAGLLKISSGLLPVDTVLMSSRAPVGYLAQAKIPVAINQGYIAMKCNKRLPPEYVLLWTDSVMDEIKQRASGSTFAEISKKSFRPIQVIVPAESVTTAFLRQTKVIYDKITESISESTALSEMRDSLLPKLLSGEITIGETERKIEAVASCG